MTTRLNRWKRRLRRTAIGGAIGAGLLVGAFAVLDRLYPLDLSCATEASVVVTDRGPEILTRL